MRQCSHWYRGTVKMPPVDSMLFISRLVNEPLTRSALAITFAPLIPMLFPWSG